MAMTVAMFAIGLLAFFYAIGKLYAMAFVTRASAAKIAAPSYSVAMPRDGTFFNLVPTDGIVHKGQPLGSFQAAMLDVVQTDIGALHLSSEERRVGNECVSTCRARWWAYPYNTKKQHKL